MICPVCGKNIEELGVVIRATQLLDLKKGKYTDIVDVEKTLSYYCPKCGEDINYGYASEVELASIEGIQNRECC